MFFKKLAALFHTLTAIRAQELCQSGLHPIEEPDQDAPIINSELAYQRER